MFFFLFFRVSVDSDVLKLGYISRDLIILENDDFGGIFEFFYDFRGFYVIKVGLKFYFGFIILEKCCRRIWIFVGFVFKGRRCRGVSDYSV